MIRLYSEGGAQDCTIMNPVFSDTVWRQLKGDVISVLQKRKSDSAVAALHTYDFQLSHGCNNYNDEFYVLHAELARNEYMTELDNASSELSSEYKAIAKAMAALECSVRFIVLTLKRARAEDHVESPAPKHTSQTVQQAIQDAETLLAQQGAKSAVDRVHTSLHGYLKEVCNSHNIPFTEGNTVNELLKAIREKEGVWGELESHEEEVTRILRSISAIFDALGHLRNKATLVHPNKNLLGEAEARLAINCTRTLIGYIDSKITP